MKRRLRLEVLGPFQTRWSDGEPASLTGRKIPALLGYLAAEGSRSHTRDQLAALLWSETGDERARHNLRQALSKIRRACGPVIVSSGDLLRLDLEICDVDAVEFERLAAGDSPEQLLRCLDLYRGDLLDGVIPREPVYDEWLPAARSRMRERACGAVDRLVRALVERERLDEAIEALRRRLAMDPVCEPAHRNLMELLARSGRRSEALKQFGACAEALDRVLGAAPSAETVSLHRSIRAEEVPPRPGAGAPTRGHDRPSVAVLPFENLSGEDEGYFVDGIVEDITTALSRFRSLLVIARGSSFAYRNRDLPDRRIAEELGAQFLVRGSVQRAGARVRINVQLLDAAAGLHVWGERFDREIEDVFLVQDEIGATVVSTLAGQVEAARLAQSRRAPPERLDAYDFYLRGKEHHHRYSAEDCRLCIDMFERAIERDPSYAAAYAWLACGLGQAMVFRLDDHARLVDRCQETAERGLQLDASESECHRVLAQVSLTRRDLTRSLWHQERALFLNPNDDRSVCSMGEILAFAGRAEEAEEWVRRSMRLNPYHPPRYWTHLARALFHRGAFREALEALDRVSRPRIDDLAYRVAAAARLGDRRAAAAALAELREAVPDFSPLSFCDTLPYGKAEDRRFLRDALEKALRGT